MVLLDGIATETAFRSWQRQLLFHEAVVLQSVLKEYDCTLDTIRSEGSGKR